MPNALKVGLPGLVLALFSVLLLRYMTQLQPLLNTPTNPETPNLFPFEIQGHLANLRSLAILTGVGALFALAGAAWAARPSSGTRAALNITGWLLQFLTLGGVILLIAGYWGKANTPGYFEGRFLAILQLAMSVLLLLPAAGLVWVAVRRLIAWTGWVLGWSADQAPGELQRQYRHMSVVWRLLSGAMLTAGALLVPLMLIDTPHPKEQTVSTLLDKTVIAQQKPVQIIATLALLAAGFSALSLLRAAAERTATLDSRPSRIDRVIRRPANDPLQGGVS